MSTIPLMQKLASVEADLVCAAAGGLPSLHAAIYQKLGELELDEPEDIEAVVVGLIGANEEVKRGAFMPGQQQGSNRMMQAIALGALLASPAMSAVKYITGKQQKEQGWGRLAQHSPELIGKDPNRAKALYDFIHDTSPKLAVNTPLAADLMKQMMAAPQLDLGTVKSMSEVSRNYSGGGAKPDIASSLVGGLKEVPGAMVGYQALSSGMPKSGSVGLPVNYISSDKIACFFRWDLESVKAAGLTDAFTGSGTVMDQANNAFGFNQQEMGNTMLPLDSVVRELVTKEVELANREQTLEQQEMQLQQAMSQFQAMQQSYMEQTQVDPATGQPVAPAGEEGAPVEGGEDPAAMPAEGDPAAIPAEGDPAADPAADPASDPAADQAAEGDPAADPAAEGDSAADPAAADSAADPAAADSAAEGDPAADPAAEGDPAPMSPDQEAQMVAAPSDSAPMPDGESYQETPTDGSAVPAEGAAPTDTPVDGDAAAAPADGDDTSGSAAATAEDDEDDEDGKDGDAAPAEGENAPPTGGEEEGAQPAAPVQLPQQLTPEEEAQGQALMQQSTETLPPGDETPAASGVEGEPDETPGNDPQPGPIGEEGAVPPEGEELPPEGGTGEELPPEGLGGEEPMPPEGLGSEEPMPPEIPDAGGPPPSLMDSGSMPEAPGGLGAGGPLPGLDAGTPATPGTIRRTINIPLNIEVKISEAAVKFDAVNKHMMGLFRP